MFNRLNPLKKYKPTGETITQATRMLIKDKQRIALYKKREAAKASRKKPTYTDEFGKIIKVGGPE